MNSVMTMRRLVRATLTLAVMMAASQTFAAGTPSNTLVENTATITYQVAGATQPEIESSPTGNSTPGVGNGSPTTFVVDNMVDLTVTEVGSGATTVTPGGLAFVTTFNVQNTGNTVQDYALVASNLASTDPAVHTNADTDVDMTNLRVFVDGNNNGTYEPGTDTATFIDDMAPDVPGGIVVFVLADAPAAGNAAVANVRLTAVTYDAAGTATTLTVETAGADTANVDVVFADDVDRDGLEFADDSYVFESADLLVSKTTSVVSDPFNGATDPKAIPGAVVEYVIELANGGVVDAENISVSDDVPTEVVFLPGAYAGNDIEIRIGAGPASTIWCTADTGDADGCGLVGNTLTVAPAGGLTVGTIPTETPVRVLFQATIQ